MAKTNGNGTTVFASDNLIEGGGWQGRGNLSELVAEVQRQAESKLDLVVDSRDLKFGQSGADATRLNLTGLSAAAGEVLAGLPLTKRAVQQFGERMSPSIPGGFLVDLLNTRTGRGVDLLNGLLIDTGNRHFVRTLDGRVRACLSDKYRVCDNFDIALTALDAAKSAGGDVLECGISDARMFIKMTSRDVWTKIDGIQKNGKAAEHRWINGRRDWQAPEGGDLGIARPMVTISNSEVGEGGTTVHLGIFLDACNNGAILDKAVTAIHLGGKLDVGVFSAETVAADSKAIMLKARDAIRAAFTPEKFADMVAMVKGSITKPIADPASAVGNIVKNHGITEDSAKAILAHFLRDYDQTQWGLGQAVARHAEDLPGADAAIEMERIAGALLVA